MYKVFIVDDEPFILSGLQDILDWEELGLTIAGQAENGQEALEQLREIPADILITDISMPVMTGLEPDPRCPGIPPGSQGGGAERLR